MVDNSWFSHDFAPHLHQFTFRHLMKGGGSTGNHWKTHEIFCFECDQGHQIRFLLAINLRIKPATILKHAITNVLQITERKAYLIRKLHIYVYIYNVYLYLYKSSNKLQRCSTKLVMWVPNLG